jgi:hypothetical protein
MELAVGMVYGNAGLCLREKSDASGYKEEVSE